MEELSIKVNIADRLFPLTINKEEEEMVRKAAKLIQDKLKHLQQQFAVKDKQDMLSMISLELATQLLRLQEENKEGMGKTIEELRQLKAILQDITI